MSGFRFRHEVSFADTNVVGNVYFARYLDWQGRCRERFLHEQAPEVAGDVTGGRLALVTVSCSMEYFEELFAFDDVTVDMTPGEISAHRVGMRFRYGRDGVEVARGTQTVACMARGSDGLEPVPVPSSLVAAMRRFA